MNKILLSLFIVSIVSCQSIRRINLSKLTEIPFEIAPNTSANYHEIIDYYASLAKSSPYVQVNAFGTSDAGEALTEVIIDKSKQFTPEKLKAAGKTVLFINNGIHAGEPCGIDACMLMTKELLSDKSLFKLLENTVIVIVPVYNIGGIKNRGSFSRANQNGPLEHGFRGNAKNLDLNRDFTKCDSKNARSFNQLFTKWSPDVMVDTHTSNGADYQHIISLIATQKDKLAPSLGSYLDLTFLPKIYAFMSQDGYDMVPYVYSKGATPDDKGIMAFPDIPRYSTGYAATHHTLGFMPETHMLKTFEERVLSTKSFLVRMIELLDQEGPTIQANRKEAIEYYFTLKNVPINWIPDESIVRTTTFRGYESGYKPSEISGQPRLFYDRNKPFTKEIDYYNEYKVSKVIRAPEAYIIPQAYSEVIERLQWNGVQMIPLNEDKMMDVEMYYIEDFETRDQPYEGHYLHSNTRVRAEKMSYKFHKGDYIIPLDQVRNRYIIEMLEPEAPDSYFSWNFFDGILMQKEYFSPYVFEELAQEILRNNPSLQKELDKKKKEDPAFAQNGYGQLDFIYKHSPYYELSYKLYPIGRILE